MSSQVNPATDHEDQEDQTYNPLKWFNRLSFLFGMSLSVKGLTRPLRFYHRFHGIVNITYLVFSLVYDFHETISRPQLANITLNYYTVGLVIKIFIIQFFGQTFSEQIHDMIQECSRHQKKVIEWLTYFGWSVLLTDRIVFTIIFYSMENIPFIIVFVILS